MKGVVFTTFAQLVEEKFGLDVWDDILDEADPESGGSTWRRIPTPRRSCSPS